MDTNDITTRVLVEIRGRMTGFETRMDRMEARIDTRMDAIEARMEGLEDRLGDRITDTEVRLSTAVFGLQGTLTDVQRMLRPLHARFGPRKLPDD